MKWFKRKIVLFGLILPIISYASDTRPNREIDDVNQQKQLPKLSKIAGFADEAIGVMDKGQLQNLTMNYGQITDTRYEDVGNAPSQYFYDFRYPRKNYTGVADDFSIFFALPQNSENGNNGNVIDGWTDNDNEDWVAKDGAYGATHYNPATDPTPHAAVLYPPDNPTTPYLASSDLPATWPVDDNGNPFWPGYFRREVSTGEAVEGEFASDRDVYAVFTDANNQLGNPVGLEVEMMAYCYGRPYADKFQFYEFFIHNKSGKRLDSCWVGYYHDPDCSDYAEEILILPDANFSDPNITDIILQRDIDGDIGGATRPNSKGVTEDYSYGVAILETPKDMGVTSFHYYQDSGPTDDAILWPIISNNPNDPDIASFSNRYFHGTDPNIDDPSLLYTVDAQDLVYIVASGPFSMEPGEVVKSTVVVAVGEDDADFYAQIDQAKKMFDFHFVGPSAPPAPKLTATKGDGKVTLYWDATPETTPDPFTKDIDFEGYRMYRSEDNGQTWGDEIKDAQGNLIGYLPLAQFDLANDIVGLDSRNPFTYLGNDSGLKHTYEDNNVKNGITYSYTIVCYDRGDSIIYSLESARGTTTADKNFITVTPEPDYSGKVASDLDSFTQIAGNGNGNITVKIIDENALTDAVYQIQFNDFPAHSFNIVNTTTGESLGVNLPLNYEDNPVIEGFQVHIQSDEQIGGIQSVTDGYGIDVFGEGKQDSSHSWLVSAAAINGASLESRSHDYEIRFVESGDFAYSWGKPSSSQALFRTSFQVWDVTPGENHKICFEVNDLNSNAQWDEGEGLMLVNVTYPEPQAGDQLTGEYPADFPYQVIIVNAPDDSLKTPPQPGDIVKINSYRSYSNNDVFAFNFKMASFDPATVELDEIRVVPNPYIVGAAWEMQQNVHQIRFMFLPPECTINVYTVIGEKVWSMVHDDYTGDETWNVTNTANQAIAFGVYVYVVSTPDGQKHTGKFSIIR